MKRAITEKNFRPIRGGITAPQGFLASGMACGIKKQGILDLCLILSKAPATAAAVFTRNQATAAPIVWSRKALKHPYVRAVIVNSGNANACTGREGLRHAEETAATVAHELALAKEEVITASTGVIGLPLPIDRIVPAIPNLVQRVSKSGGKDGSRAIMTTDTVPKTSAYEWKIQGKKVRIGGMAKGSGMIHPNMATMLAFIATDAALEPEILQTALQEAVENSFHRITVDGDSSTNDMVLVMANGLSGASIGRKELVSSGFQEALNKVSLDLAQAMVQDGEGATKFATIQVVNGKSKNDCLTIAKKIACSSLVKTALFGEDANWGRIMAAAGASGVPIRPEKIEIHFDAIPVVQQGITLGSEQEKKAGRSLKKKKVTITVDLHLGNASAEVYTSDLSYDYIKINADYRS